MTVVLSLAVFLGFAFFFVTEKLSRTFGGEEHSHSHSHSHAEPVTQTTGVPEGFSTSVTSSTEKNLRLRHAKGDVDDETAGRTALDNSPVAGPSKLSAYLNL